MKKYYCFVNSFYNNGKVVALINEKECVSRPENTGESDDKKDTYFDWSDTMDEALRHQKECFEA